MPNDETLAHPAQPRVLFSAWLWAVTLFVFFGVIVAITFGTMQRGSNYENERAKTRAEKLKTAREEWNAKLNSYGWVDKTKGVAFIPIDRAMELELADLQSQKPAPAGPIDLTATGADASATGASQPANPPGTAPAASASPAPNAAEGPGSEIHGQPAAAANPPNGAAGTQPGANATPAAGPKTQSAVPPVSPTGTPILKPPGKPFAASRRSNSMSVSDFFARVKCYDRNATVIFDPAEPIGRATDLVLPDRRWFNRKARREILPSTESATQNS